MRALRMSHRFTLVSPAPRRLPSGWLVFVCLFGFVWAFVLLVLFCSARGFLLSLIIPPRVVDLDARQCFTARSARRKKKMGPVSDPSLLPSCSMLHWMQCRGYDLLFS